MDAKSWLFTTCRPQAWIFTCKPTIMKYSVAILNGIISDFARGCRYERSAKHGTKFFSGNPEYERPTSLPAGQWPFEKLRSCKLFTNFHAVFSEGWAYWTKMVFMGLVCPLIEIELHHKDERKARDLLNLTIPDFTTLGHILTYPGQGKQQNIGFWEDWKFSRITFALRKMEQNPKHHRIPLVETHQNIAILTPKGQ